MACGPEIARVLEQIRERAGRGEIAAAEVLCRELLDASPREAEGWSWLGLLRLARSQFDEAESAFRQAIELRGEHAPYWSYLSAVARGQTRYEEAELLARKAIALDEKQPAYWNNLANALFDLKQWREAADAYRAATELNPNDAALWQSLAVAEQEAGNFDAAQEAFQRALKLNPDGDALIGYAWLLNDLGQPLRAIEILHSVIRRRPQLAIAWLVLCRVAFLMNDLKLVEVACRRVLELTPQDREARFYLAEVLQKTYRLAEAEAVGRQLVHDAPDYSAGWTTLGLTLRYWPGTDESLDVLRRAVEREQQPFRYSKLLFAMQYADDVDPQGLRDAHEQWTVDYVKASAVLPPAKVRRRSGEKLRLGFLSGDLGVHPVSFLSLGALEHLDKSQCSIACYSDRTAEDEVTGRYRAIADEWRMVCGMADQLMAEQIRRDEIDVLFDLAGHFGNRLGVFAREPAQLQVTWLGYVGTTGLRAMDYLLADRFHVRDGEERFYTETVLRMPADYACYNPPRKAPEVASLPALRSGHVTFGSFNNPAKFSRTILDAWSTILHRVPTAHMFFKFGWLGPAEAQSRLRNEFAQRGVHPERILIGFGAPHYDLLQAYGRVDLALDTQPYSGGLTTCEALYMGVPVITFPGRTFAGRHATSHLTNAGFPQFVAENLQGYIELAVEWAGRPDELAALRSQMRQQVLQSPLCDAPRFARDFLNVIQQAWRSRMDGV